MTPTRTAPATSAPLTNLAHLDFLTDTVVPPSQAGHTTYRLAEEPAVGVLWVYADHQADGSYRRVGGGAFDAATNTYGQGAFDADDIARAAVVYLRHWTRYRDAHSLQQARGLLRGLTYLQTATGPHAGDVVLWMQPDGTLTPSATPKELPDPSDSGPSFWLARTVWALGEGYAALRQADPAFAAFLRTRLDLAITALDRDVLTRYGQYRVVDGTRMPAWLVVDGADASSEAVLGLAAAVRAGHRSARPALSKLADGIAAMGRGTADTWPYGAILPSATSQTLWHAWGAQMPAALAEAATVLDRPDLLPPAVADAATFTPRLLTATGPDNGWMPTPVDGSQIAYGADARVQSLLAVGDAAHAPGLRRVAGLAAAWFFGLNRAGTPMYDPATGVTHDGISPTGDVNLNSGAESTIHGLLTMQALDAAPDVAATARAATRLVLRDGQRTVEAESGTPSGGATAAPADPVWTGESQWGGGAFVLVTPGSTVTWSLPAAEQPRLVQAVVDVLPGPGAVSTFSVPAGRIGTVGYGGGGAQGVSPAPGALLPGALRRAVGPSAQDLTAITTRGTGRLDALLVTPVVSALVADGDGHSVALLANGSDRTATRTLTLPRARTVVQAYDRHGRLSAVSTTAGGMVRVAVPAGGFAIVWQ